MARPRRPVLARDRAGPDDGRRSGAGRAARDRRSLPGPLRAADVREPERYGSSLLTARHPGCLAAPRRASWLGIRAGPEGVSVIVPLVADDNDLDSATTPSAFGAIAASFPPSPVIMAETLVHEFQHLKLCALMNIVPLIG